MKSMMIARVVEIFVDEKIFSDYAEIAKINMGEFSLKNRDDRSLYHLYFYLQFL